MVVTFSNDVTVCNGVEDDDGRDQEATDERPCPAAVVRPRTSETVRPVLGIHARCPGGAASRP